MSVELERQLRRSEARRQAVTREMDRLTSIVSHDLRAPLRGMAHLLEELREQLELEGEAAEIFELVELSVGRLQRLVQDLLGFSRMREADLEFEDLPLQEALDAALETRRDALEALGAQVSVGPLPTIRGDRESLQVVFEHLLDNACTFREETCAPQIEIEARTVGPEWEVRVRDHGMGIPPDKLDSAFDAFRRLHSATRYPGRGLGLAVCARIINLHGGTVVAEAPEGGGTAIVFVLPDASGPDAPPSLS